jgi:hypothetical protein
MLTSPENRKSPCANTGWNSQKILSSSSSSHHSMSIHPARSIANVFFGWVSEAQRLHKLAMETGREIHAIALERHLSGVSEKIGRFC